MELDSSTEDPFGNNRRQWTILLKHPFESYCYLLASPMYFRSKICFWFGNLNDCYIGRCSSANDKFKRIDSSTTFEILQESDVEDELVGFHSTQERSSAESSSPISVSSEGETNNGGISP